MHPTIEQVTDRLRERSRDRRRRYLDGCDRTLDELPQDRRFLGGSSSMVCWQRSR